MATPAELIAYLRLELTERRGRSELPSQRLDALEASFRALGRLDNEHAKDPLKANVSSQLENFSEIQQGSAFGSDPTLSEQLQAVSNFIAPRRPLR